MRLLSLRLENFRQHKLLELQFPSGLTGILGVNGSGKSTILEAIAWGIYGNQAGVVRGELESLIWRFAPGKSSAVAEVEFELNQQVYTVKRSQSSKTNTAELRQGERVLANSTKAVNERIGQILGMSHQEFFNSYFTAQGDLNFLGSIKGALDRERFIAKMLGYDRISEVQGATGKKGTIRDDKNEVEKSVNRLEGGLEDQVQILSELQQYQSQLKVAEQNQTDAEQLLNLLNQQLQQLIPQAQLASQKSDRYQQINQNKQISQVKLAQNQAQSNQLTEERSLLDQKVKVLSQLEAEVSIYSQLQQQLTQLELDKQDSEQQQNLVISLDAQQTELAKITTQIEQLSHIPEAISQSQIAIANYQDQVEQQQTEVNAQTQIWQQSQASLKATIESEKQNLKKLESQKLAIANAGVEGHCPTCERPLLDEYNRVIAGFEQQIENSQQNLSSSQQQLKMQQKSPAFLVEAEAILRQIKQLQEQERKDQMQLSIESTKLELFGQTAQKLEQEVTTKKAKISEFDNRFEPQVYNQVKSQLAQLKPKYEEYLRSADSVAQLSKIELKLEQINQTIDSVLAEIKQQDQQLLELDFNLTEYQNLKIAIANLEAKISQAQQSQARSSQQLALAKQALEVTQTRADQLTIKAAELKIAKQELLMLREIDLGFTALRQHLTEQIRPQLADNASIFLNQLTEGRYNALEIDSKYNVIVLDQGDRKPVISGGEQDIVNLCLRLAISQMIAERSGQSFSLLILDEVFGSLDQGRQDNLIALLHNLETQFEQVLLITHIDSIKDSLNHTIRLEFDAQTGSSRIAI